MVNYDVLKVSCPPIRYYDIHIGLVSVWGWSDLIWASTWQFAVRSSNEICRCGQRINCETISDIVMRNICIWWCPYQVSFRFNFHDVWEPFKTQSRSHQNWFSSKYIRSNFAERAKAKMSNILVYMISDDVTSSINKTECHHKKFEILYEINLNCTSRLDRDYYNCTVKWVKSITHCARCLKIFSMQNVSSIYVWIMI